MYIFLELCWWGLLPFMVYASTRNIPATIIVTIINTVWTVSNLMILKHGDVI